MDAGAQVGPSRRFCHQLPADVAPGAELVADLAVHAEVGEADGFVEGHAGLVGQGDAGEDGVHTLTGEDGEEGLVQAATYALASSIGVEVDGEIDGPGVGGAVSVAGGVGVAADGAGVFGDQPREGLEGGGDAASQLGLRRGLELEGDDGVSDDGGVDAVDGRGVEGCGDSQAHRGGFPTSGGCAGWRDRPGLNDSASSAGRSPSGCRTSFGARSPDLRPLGASRSNSIHRWRGIMTHLRPRSSR